MLHPISWGSYWTVLLISLVLYYGYVAWVNRNDWFAPRTPAAPVLPEVRDEFFPQADACSQELGAYFEQVAYGKPSKNELVFGIHQVLKKYPSLPGTSHEGALSQFIRSSVRDQCTIHLSDEEIRQVWLV